MRDGHPRAGFPSGWNCSKYPGAANKGDHWPQGETARFLWDVGRISHLWPQSAFRAGQQVMMKKRLLRHGPAVALGIGAGIAAAVLCSLLVRGTFVAAVLASVSPLPIMIATLGYGGFARAAAGASSMIAVGGLVDW